MKGGLARSQLMVLGAGLVGVGLAGTLAWMGLGSLGEKQEEARVLAEKMGNPSLASLLADPAGLSKIQRETAEIEKIDKELRENDARSLKGWMAATLEAWGDGEEWSHEPGRWKDRLIAVQNELQKKASASRLSLKPDFYLGLDAYRQKSPMPQEVPELAMHLSVAKRLVEKLIEARKVREQYATVCEFKSLSGPGSSLEEAAPASPVPPSRPGTPPTGPERRLFLLEIQCSPEVLFEYVRLLSRDDWFFLVKNLSVANPKQDFPPRSEIEKRFRPAETQEKSASKKKLLEILGGDESLDVRMEVEFVAWKAPGSGKATGSPEKKP